MFQEGSTSCFCAATTLDVPGVTTQGIHGIVIARCAKSFIRIDAVSKDMTRLKVTFILVVAASVGVVLISN